MLLVRMDSVPLAFRDTHSKDTEACLSPSVRAAAEWPSLRLPDS